MKQLFLKNVYKKSRRSVQGGRGFSLVELVIIIAMTAVIATLTLFAFRGFSNYQLLDKQADVVHSYIEKSRLEALNSKNFSDFGMRFATSAVTIFQGPVYAASTSNIVYNFSSGVEISSIALTGGATDVYFENITGEPNATGTITLRLTAAPSSTKQIIIYGTGLSEVR